MSTETGFGLDRARAIPCTVVVPTRSGGALLRRLVRNLTDGQTLRPLEVLLVDSGSEASELALLETLGARIVRFPERTFDHGLARDVGASEARGEVLAFLNQDALPCDEQWLERLAAPFGGPAPPAAVQGGIREWEAPEAVGLRRFYWDSCGPRFYFTTESVSWIERHGGIGFSTVNCALARSAWEALPFGRAPILEDKRWQRAAAARGWSIASAPRAAVWHTHDYDLRALARRCVSEGFGWRGVDERYPLRQALSDLVRRAPWREWAVARRSERGLRPAELLFPALRPLALWWGNRWAGRVLH